MALDDLSGFPKLPIELRLKIWKMSLPGPRLVEIYLDEENNSVRAYEPPPVAFSVCRESREVASKVYWIKGSSKLRRFYPKIDPSIDTVFYRWDYRCSRSSLLSKDPLPCFAKKEQEAIQFLATKRGWFGSDMTKLVKFKGLKIINLVIFGYMPLNHPKDWPRIELVHSDSVTRFEQIVINCTRKSLAETQKKFPEWQPPEYKLQRAVELGFTDLSDDSDEAYGN